MAENQDSSHAPNDSEWQSLVDDVENRFVALSDALADLRGAVTRLTAQRPAMTAASNGWAAPQSEEPEVATAELVAAFEEAATAFEGALNEEPVEEPVAVEEAEPVAEHVAVEEAEPVPEPVAFVEQTVEAPTVEDEEAKRREEVSRMVAQAKQELNAQSSTSEGSWPVTKPLNASEVDSTSEGSWPMAGGPVKSHSFPHSEPAKFEDEKVDDVVAEAELVVEAAEQDDEARREEVARMVAEMRAGLVPGEPEAAAVDSTEPKRDVAKMIADMRANMANSDDSNDDSDEAAEGEAIETDEPVAAAPEIAGQKGAASDEDVRDEVRRAVEAAKAEMAAGWVKSAPDAGATTAGDSKFSFPDWQNTRIEPSGPPVIVIKDTEGRVELARVYETLSQVKCDENAALLNYTPHSVTVGLNTRAQVPTKEALEAAVRVVFGRKCRVESDGVRLSVDIGKDLGKEDAA